ncbi:MULTISPECIES: hypothetical protein [Thermocrispum]|uniref:Helix-turn-helix transcriptional regulator n=1 Tax=Thermocrispum agreste TaxID=37925 RepID=A0ABD6FI95_9PSEU|nr:MULTISPECIES: hypothetical protein [Thermocrispum]
MHALPADLRAMAFRGAPIDNRALAAAATADPATRWLAAVTVGAQGRYAAAYALLEPLSVATDPVLASLACSTIGSHRRQLGGHHAARRWDALAARHAARARSDGVGTDPDGIGPTGALADALLGLAADALAVGRLAEAAALVDRAAAPARGSWRTRVRHAWVSAELVLASGRASAAVAPAERAAALAREHGAARHAVKSDIVLAVALATAGSAGERARRLALQALEATEGAGWHSLCWPAALAAADASADAGDGRSAAWLRRRAGDHLHRVLRAADAAGRRIAEHSPWVPNVDKLLDRAQTRTFGGRSCAK